jgi:hypothetical protein
MGNVQLQPEQIAQFHRDGVLVLRSVYDSADVEAVQKSIYEVIGLVMKRHGLVDTRKSFSPAHFDDGYNAMILHDRVLGAEIYDAVKQLPAFIRLLSHPLHEDLMRQLRPGSQPGIAANGYGVRIDNPNEDNFRAQWHQEYPAQLRSLNGLVFWASLVPVTEALGPVEFCLGSHAEGALPVRTGAINSRRKGAYNLLLHNEAYYLAKYPHVAPPSEPGDLVVIDFLVLHASGINRSDRSRWTMQFRYFDFVEPTGMAHGWKGSFASGVEFRQIHPELCVD